MYASLCIMFIWAHQPGNFFFWNAQQGRHIYVQHSIHEVQVLRGLNDVSF